ncbi:glycosyl transferases group 1 [bacterium BMS3Abin03]|nr:glycosyl transferases group 1 [bacterium BMS3Abin03]
MNTDKRINILFINDGSLDNPIILSQGLPLLKSISGNKFNPCFVSFEPGKSSEEVLNKLSGIRRQYDGEITFITTQLKYRRFLPNWLIFFFAGITSVSKIIKNEKIKILHARSLFPAIIGWVMKLRFPGVKLLYDNRGVFIEEEIFKNHWRRKSLKVKLFEYLEKRVIKKSDAIVVVSRAFKKYMIEKFEKYDDNLNRKVQVIPNRTIVSDRKENEFSNINHKKENIVGVYSGSAASWQNISELLQFINECKNVFPDFLFKIVSYQIEEFKSIIKTEQNLIDKIEFIIADSTEVIYILSDCDFGVLLRENNLINRVSSPLKFAEYLAAGIPVVVSEGVGDTKDIIRKYNVGVIIKNNDYSSAVEELIRLLQDEEISKRCFLTAKNELNLEQSIDQYKNIYKNLNDE